MLASVGLASLVLAITAIIFGLIPLIYTQLVGLVIGVISVILGVWGRKQARGQGRSTAPAIAGIVVGLLAIVVSGTLYATFIYSGKRAGEEVVRRVGSEIDRGRAQGNEFRKSMERAIERAHQEKAKAAARAKGKLRKTPR
jgi:hypothetical protein